VRVYVIDVVAVVILCKVSLLMRGNSLKRYRPILRVKIWAPFCVWQSKMDFLL
jgi:hypothetical protein